MNIAVAAVDGSGITALTHPPAGGFWPVWSPDGSRLAYDGPSATAGMYQVVTVNPDGSDPITLDHPPLGCNCGVVWSPDGTLLTVYQDGPAGHEDTGGSMLMVDVSGKEPVQAIPYAGLSDQLVSSPRNSRGRELAAPRPIAVLRRRSSSPPTSDPASSDRRLRVAAGCKSCSRTSGRGLTARCVRPDTNGRSARLDLVPRG